MTEQEWLAMSDDIVKYQALRDRASDRKLRHFAIACARTVLDRADDPAAVAAVEFGERFADVGVARRKGLGPVVKALSALRDAVEEAAYRIRGGPALSAHLVRSNALAAAASALEPEGWFAACLASGFAANVVMMEWCRDNDEGPPSDAPNHPVKRAELRRQQPLQRDIFALAFRPPPAVAPEVLAWGAGTVVKLAQGIYDEAAFGRLPVLADALEDAGCTEQDVLNHLRGGEPHARGCWAVDLILGKE